MSVKIGTTTYTARAYHIVALVYDINGDLVRSDNTFNRVFETEGARISAIETSLNGLKMDLIMPTLVINPGESMSVTFLLETNAGAFDSSATSNFLNDTSMDYNEGGYIRLILPAGVVLDNDADPVVTLNWVTNAPTPVMVPIGSIMTLILTP